MQLKFFRKQQCNNAQPCLPIIWCYNKTAPTARKTNDINWNIIILLHPFHVIYASLSSSSSSYAAQNKDFLPGWLSTKEHLEQVQLPGISEICQCRSDPWTPSLPSKWKQRDELWWKSKHSLVHPFPNLLRCHFPLHIHIILQHYNCVLLHEIKSHYRNNSHANAEWLGWVLCGLICVILFNPSRSRKQYSIVLPLENQ